MVTPDDEVTARIGLVTRAVPGRVLRSGLDTDTVHAGADWTGGAR
jgi:hypothetical protein